MGGNEDTATDRNGRSSGLRTSGFVINRPDLPGIDRYVVAGVIVQLVGYAALSSLVPHSDFASVVEPLGRVPAILLVPVAVLAVPAVVLAIVFGALLSVVGLQPTVLLVFASTYVVIVVSLWVYRRVKGRASVTNA